MEDLLAYCMRGDVCGWPAVWHTISRQPLHIATSAGLVMLCLTLQMELAERGWLPKARGYYFFAFAPLAALFLIQGREAFDASAGDSPLKSLVDVYLGWLGGSVLSCIGLYRLTPRLHEARAAIFQQRLAAEQRRRKS